MKNITFLGMAILFLITTSVFGDDEGGLERTNENIIVPVVYGTASVTNKRVGMVVYDASTSQFKGLNGSGNWDTMTVAGGNQVTSYNASERIERVMVHGATPSANCTSSCSVTPTGTWVTSVTRTGNGAYTVNIAAGIFSAAPICVVSGGDATSTLVFPKVDMANVTSTAVPVGSLHSSTGTNTDTRFTLICMGPR